MKHNVKRKFSFEASYSVYKQIKSPIKTGRTPGKKWSGQNLTGRTVGSGPDWYVVMTPENQCKQVALLLFIICRHTKPTIDCELQLLGIT